MQLTVLQVGSSTLGRETDCSLIALTDNGGYNGSLSCSSSGFTGVFPAALYDEMRVIYEYLYSRCHPIGVVHSSLVYKTHA